MLTTRRAIIADETQDGSADNTQWIVIDVNALCSIVMMANGKQQSYIHFI